MGSNISEHSQTPDTVDILFLCHCPLGFLSVFSAVKCYRPEMNFEYPTSVRILPMHSKFTVKFNLDLYLQALH